MKKSLFIAVSLCGLLFSSSCTQSKSAEIDAIKVEFGAPIENFTELIESVEYIPLETDSVHFVGYNPQLYVSDDSYYMVDNVMASRIYRYDLKGKFLNKIGQKGRGSGEYGELDGFRIIDDTVVVFSNNDKMLKFSPMGELIEERIIPNLLRQSSYYIGDGYLYYFGFGPNFKGRLMFISRDTSKNITYLTDDERNNKVLTGKSTKRFSHYGDNIYIKDGEEPHLLKYSNNNVEVYHKFDFGQYSLPEKYYQFDNPFESMNYLSTLDKMAGIQKFNKSSDFEILEVYYIDADNSNMLYGLKTNEEWIWFEAGSIKEEPLSGAFKDLKGDSLYFLVFPNLVNKLPELLGSKAINPEAIKDVTEESNYVIVKINLKRDIN